LCELMTVSNKFFSNTRTSNPGIGPLYIHGFYIYAFNQL
jgi:hypothetical protein